MIKTLVEEAKKGKKEAIEKLYNLFLRKIYNFIYTMIKDEDEVKELTQETFFKAFSNINKLRKDEYFEQWLYKIARNEVYQLMKKSKKFVENEVGMSGKKVDIFNLISDIRSNPEKSCLDDELQNVIDDAISRLPVKQKEVFILAVIQKKSYSEVSEIVGRSLLSVKSDIFRARSFVKEYIKKRLGIN